MGDLGIEKGNKNEIKDLISYSHLNVPSRLLPVKSMRKSVPRTAESRDSCRKVLLYLMVKRCSFCIYGKKRR